VDTLENVSQGLQASTEKPSKIKSLVRELIQMSETEERTKEAKAI